jgi:hypothetical protein
VNQQQSAATTAEFFNDIESEADIAMSAWTYQVYEYTPQIALLQGSQQSRFATAVTQFSPAEIMS